MKSIYCTVFGRVVVYNNSSWLLTLSLTCLSEDSEEGEGGAMTMIFIITEEEYVGYKGGLDEEYTSK